MTVLLLHPEGRPSGQDQPWHYLPFNKRFVATWRRSEPPELLEENKMDD